MRSFLENKLFINGSWIWYSEIFLNCDAIESETHPVMSDSLRLHGLYCPWNSPGQNIGVGSLSLLQGIFPTQGLNPDLPQLQADSLPAEPQQKPKNTGWVAHPFSSGSSWPRVRTRVSYFADRFFTNWAIRKPIRDNKSSKILYSPNDISKALRE